MAGPMPGAARASTVAVLSGLLVATAHVAGGGSAPDVAVLGLLLPSLAAVLLGLARRRRGPFAAFAVLAAGQAGLHTVLSVLHHHPGEGDVLTGGPAMLPAHAAATAATAVLLARADTAFAAVGAALRRVLPRRRPAPAADAPLPARPVPAPGLAARVTLVPLSAHLRRGPPVPC